MWALLVHQNLCIVSSRKDKFPKSMPKHEKEKLEKKARIAQNVTEFQGS